MASQSMTDTRLQQLGRMKEAGIRKLSDQDKNEIAKAARGFESMFVHIMVKEMKRAMLDDPKEEMNFGADTLLGYGDMLMSDHISNSGSGMGIAEMLYKQLTGEKLPLVTVRSAKLFPEGTGPVINPNQKPFNYSGGSFIKRMDDKLLPYSGIINKASEKFNVPENIIKAVITAESAGRPDAVSRAGAKGLMQLMDGTASDLGVSNPFDPNQNIAGGTQYLSKMLSNYDGNLELALAAYNAGPGNVQKYKGVPPFSETKAYINRVKRFAGEFQNGTEKMK